MQFLDADPNFAWNEMCQRQIGGVMADCSILEGKHFMLCSEYSLFNRFREFGLGNHTDNTLYLVNTSYLNIIWCLFKHWRQRNGFHWRLAHFGRMSTFRTEGSERADSTFRIGTFPSWYLHFNAALFGGGCNQSSGSSIIAYRNQSVRSWSHKSFLWFFRSSDTGTDVCRSLIFNFNRWDRIHCLNGCFHLRKLFG